MSVPKDLKAGDLVIVKSSTGSYQFPIPAKVMAVSDNGSNEWTDVFDSSGNYATFCDNYAEDHLVSIFPCKIFISNKEYSRKVQNWLFEQGCEWVSTGKNYFDINIGRSILVNKDKKMFDNYSSSCVNCVEFVLQFETKTVLKGMEVYYPRQKVKETVEFNGKTYYKDELEERLSSLKEVN